MADEIKPTLTGPPTESTHPELFANVTSGLADLDDGEPSIPLVDAAPAEPVAPAADPPQEPASEAAEPAPAVETSEGKPPAVEAEVAQEPTEAAQEAAANAQAADAPILPEAHLRTLKHFGWSDEEIERSQTVDPQGLIATGERLHVRRNEQTAEMGRIGRQLQEREEAGEPAPAGQPPAPTPAEGALSLIDVEALKAEHGDDPLIDKIAAPVNAAIAQLNAALPEITGSVERIQAADADAMGRQIDTFFGQDHVTPFGDFYGSSFLEATPEQVENRNAVLVLADQILAGAEHQGREVSAEDALDAAHGSVSAGFTRTAARKEVAASVKKRAESVTLRPTDRSQTSVDGKPTMNELERKVGVGLAAAFPTD